MEEEQTPTSRVRSRRWWTLAHLHRYAVDQVKPLREREGENKREEKFMIFKMIKDESYYLQGLVVFTKG